MSPSVRQPESLSGSFHRRSRARADRDPPGPEALEEVRPAARRRPPATGVAAICWLRAVGESHWQADGEQHRGQRVHVGGGCRFDGTHRALWSHNGALLGQALGRQGRRLIEGASFNGDLEQVEGLGSLTLYGADDPNCAPHVVQAGQSFIEPIGTVLIARNESPTERASWYATHIGVPTGVPTTTDESAPGNCAF